MAMSRRTAHRLALHYAIAERDSFAAATANCGDGQSEKASALASELRRVLREEFGEVTADDAFEAEGHRTVSIFDIQALQAEQGAE